MTTAGNATNENVKNETAAKKPEKPGISAVIWSSARACVFLAAAIVFLVLGNNLRPGGEPQLPVSEPTVTVVTTDPQFAGSVNMTLFASGQKNQSYTLKVAITPATTVPKVTQVEVSFGSVPHHIPGLNVRLVSSPQSGNEYYEPASRTVTATGTETYTSTYTSLQQIGEAASGGRLRVAFPTFTGETPGVQYSTPACGSQGSLIAGPYADLCSRLPGNAGQWSVPVLQAGQSTLTSGGLSLAGYQYVAGDAPTLLNGSSWAWTGVNGATVLAADLQAEATQQSNVFKSGIYLGVGAAAALAFITELLRPVWRRDP